MNLDLAARLIYFGEIQTHSRNHGYQISKKYVKDNECAIKDEILKFRYLYQANSISESCVNCALEVSKKELI